MITSINFPEMFSGTSTNVVEYREATINNLKLILQSSVNSLFGDPAFGNNLKQVIFSQNDYIIRDLIIDEIYTCIEEFIPQLLVQRENIEVLSDGTNIFTQITGLNQIDHTVDLYEIQLTTEIKEN